MNKVGALGPAGTFSAEAAKKAFPDCELEYQNSISDVFSAVDKGKCEYGVVPIENSIEGSVSETIRGLEEYDLQIVGEVYLKIEHVLAGTGRLSDVKSIYTHAQAAAQCRKKIKSLFKTAPKMVTEEGACLLSTASAIELVAESKDPSKAAIGSESAAKRYGLKVLSKNVSEAEDNETRFFVISKKGHAATGKDKTSIVVGIKDESGALYNLLGIFAEADINLTKIESRPRRGKKWEYVFFIDLVGHEKDKKISGVLKDVKKNSIYFKVLGSYPRAR